jgi:hypothetical protein
MANAKTTKPTPEPIRVVENPFGDFSEEQMAGSPAAPDHFFLKGYSDKRHQRDLDIKAGKKPAPLTHRFQWVSVEKPDGKATHANVVRWQAQGYRTVMFDDLKDLGIEVDESNVNRGPDGSVRVGTQVLMVTDAINAARNFERVRRETERQFEAHVTQPLAAAAEKYNKKYGLTERTGTKTEVETETKVKERKKESTFQFDE